MALQMSVTLTNESHGGVVVLRTQDTGVSPAAPAAALGALSMQFFCVY